MLAAGLRSRTVSRLDVGVQQWVLASQSPGVQGIARAVTIVGGITAMRAVGAATAVWLWRRPGWRTAATVVVMPLLAELLCDGAKRWFSRPRPAGLGQGVDATYAFPSAHAFVSAATCVTIAWLCRRDALVSREAALLVAIGVPALVGASRVFLNVHWTSDVLGGWTGGVALASLAVALHGSAATGARA